MVIAGEPVTVTPRVALTLALGLHELTTNATKYGALSVPLGRVEVSWRIERRTPQRPALRIEWREQGGPPVVPPKQRGFGTRFVEGSVASELQGRARIQYEPNGLVCTMDIPLDLVVPDTEVGPHD